MADGAFALCADDYAINGAVTGAIVTLAAAGRLSATSAMTTSPQWTEDAARLDDLPPSFGVGLHFDLTERAPLGSMPALAPSGALPSVGTVVRRAWLRTLDLGEIRTELARQLDAFEAALGRRPDHVDGHQYVHALPGVREALFDELTERYGDTLTHLRDPADRLPAVLARRFATKALLIGTLCRGFGEAARRRGFPTNRGFSGFSSFSEAAYGPELDSAMLAMGPRHLIVCHPGLATPIPDPADPLARRRVYEYEHLRDRADLESSLLPGRTTR